MWPGFFIESVYNLRSGGGMSVSDELLQANEQYAKTFDRGDLAMPPARKLAVVTCMDARIDPARAFGLEEGDAHVIRNAGGRAREALRSLVISQRLLGTKEIAIVHHTDCGMLTFTNRDLHEKVKRELGADSSDIDFLPFADLEESVREDVAFLSSSPLIPGDVVIRGFVYDVKTGRLNEVEVESAVQRR
jgi:carbonic anhydrase